MKQRTLVLFLFILSTLSIKGYAVNKDSLITGYQMDEEWYLQLQGGASYIAAENTRFVKFWKVLSPQMAFSVGKRFTPVWGARLQLVGGDDKGVFKADKNSPIYSFGHYGVLGVASFNLTEFLNHKRNKYNQKKWNVSALLGVGALYTSFEIPKNAATHDVNYNNQVYVSLFGGVEVARSLSPEWEVNMELSSNWMNNNFNGQKTATSSIFRADGLVNLLVGVRYTFNSTRRKSKIQTSVSSESVQMQPIVESGERVKPVVGSEPTPISPITTEMYYSIEDLLEMIDSKESIRGKMLASTERVCFDYGKSHIKTFTSIYLDKVVELMNKTNFVLVIKGFFSHGEPVMNNSLTELRMNAVRNYLVKHGIARDRLTYQYVELSGLENDANDLKQAVGFGILPL